MLSHTERLNDMEVTSDADRRDDSYQPRKALICAVEDWLPELYKPKGQFVMDHIKNNTCYGMIQYEIRLHVNCLVA